MARLAELMHCFLVCRFHPAFPRQPDEYDLATIAPLISFPAASLDCIQYGGIFNRGRQEQDLSLSGPNKLGQTDGNFPGQYLQQPGFHFRPIPIT
jgi:hypothetical protein